MEGLAAILALGCLGYFVWYCIDAVRSLSSPLPPKDCKTGGGLFHHEPPAPPPAGRSSRPSKPSRAGRQITRP